jgi:hypothetical protein
MAWSQSGLASSVIEAHKERGVRDMRLNPPTIVIFLISFVLATLALITKLGFIPVPRYLPHQEFWLAITAYLTLMVGNLVRGL